MASTTDMDPELYGRQRPRLLTWTTSSMAGTGLGPRGRERSNERGGEGDESPSPVRGLLPARALREVLAHRLRLSGRQHPGGVLVLRRPSEVRAKVCANELPGDVEFARERLRTNVLDCGHDGLPSFARAASVPFAVCRHIIQANERKCAYAL